MAPTSFPDLSQAKVIGIDCETKDPHLKTKGPGTIRKDGFVAGVSVSTDTGYRAYFPVRHLGGGNLDPDIVFSWLRKTLSNPKQIKIGANLLYDLDWLNTEEVEVAGPCYCVQVAEALLDENKKRYALEILSHQYLGKGKDEDLLREAAEAYGIDPKAELWKLPAKYVGAYAEGDAYKPCAIFDIQKKKLEEEGLWEVFQLETELLPILLKMRLQGVPVDLEKAEAVAKEFDTREDTLRNEVRDDIGFFIDEWSGQKIAAVCDQRGIDYPRIEETDNPTFTSDWLKAHEVPWLNKIQKIRTINRAMGKFIKTDIIDAAIDGRIHARFKPTRTDDKVEDSGGTRTGRFSSSNPNLQQVPARDEELAPLIRSIFIPDPGKRWCKLDYSQQEPRISVHYAFLSSLRGAREYRDAWNNNPHMDFYEPIQTSTGLDRRKSKDCALGRGYGMGIEKMAEKAGCSVKIAQDHLDKFDSVVPFIKDLFDRCESKAKRTGFIKTILGRRRHFNTWEPFDSWKRRSRHRQYIEPLSHEKAEEKWPGVRLVRANTRNAYNSLIQGSAGDQAKQAIVDVYKDRKQVPYIVVHDEADYGVESKMEALRMKDLMERAVELEVPVVCDLDLMETWK